jgi:aspartyl/asparaginyl beta-hydroxylase (cupin superfamily)
MIRSGLERIITLTSADGDRTFFDPSHFKWVEGIENAWQVILTELRKLLEDRDRIPNFQDVSADQAVLTQGTDWKTFFLYAYGHKLEDNCARCPLTVKELQRIPGMKTAMFSILAPGKHIPEHRGPYRGVLRYHLGLVIPVEASACRIRVRDDVRHWSAGKSLIFDDSHLHEVWNDTHEERIVLFVDFERPLPFPVSVLNRAVIKRIANTEFVTDAVSIIQKASTPQKQDPER